MPKVRGLTKKQREEWTIENELKRASQDFLNTAKEKRLEDKTYRQIARELGVSANTFLQWRAGGVTDAHFGRIIAAYARMGYRLVPEQIGK